MIKKSLMPKIKEKKFHKFFFFFFVCVKKITSTTVECSCILTKTILWQIRVYIECGRDDESETRNSHF